jgi:hypothetical protein
MLGLKIHYAFGPEIQHLERWTPRCEQQKILNSVVFLRLWREMTDEDNALIYIEDKTTMPTFRGNDQLLVLDYRSLET